jgi:hypothetical protein
VAQELERHRPVEREIVPQVYASHPTFAKHAANLEVIDAAAYQRIGVRILRRGWGPIGVVGRCGECPPGAWGLDYRFGV